MIKNILILLLFIFITSCTPTSNIWNMEIDVFKENLEAGEIEFLKDFNFRKVDVSQIKRLGPGAGYYISFLYERLDLIDISIDFLEFEQRKGTDIWQKEAEKELINKYLETKQYAKAESLCNISDSNEYFDIYIESCYWQKKDAIVLSELKELPYTDERTLFKAVSSCRLSIPDYHKLFVSLFLSVSDPEIIIRAYDFLASVPSRFEGISDLDYMLFKGRNLAARNEYESGNNILKQYVNLVLPDDSLIPVLQEIKTGYKSSGKSLSGAKWFEKYITEINQKELPYTDYFLYNLYDFAGYLYRRAGYYTQASELFNIAHLLAPSNNKMRAHWYFFDSLIKTDPNRAIEYLEVNISKWEAADYFSDTLEELAVILVKENKWLRIWDIYQLIDRYADPYVLSRYAYLSARAFQEGFIGIEKYNSANLADQLYNRILRLDPKGYYGILSSYQLGVLPKILDFLPEGTDYTEQSPFELIIAGFIEYGLFDEAVSFLRNYSDEKRYYPLKQLSAELNTAGNVFDSIITIRSAVKEREGLATITDAQLIYPEAFKQEIMAVCEKEGIPVSVFFGLVREESYFTPDIISWAGAVGLSQLMPATAREVADTIGIKDPVLTDVETNLTIGSWYLGYLTKRVSNISEALFAYNGGIGRVGRWKREHGYLPADLFAESIELTETRNYVRKVLVSAVNYGYLYETLGFQEIVELFFPGILK